MSQTRRLLYLFHKPPKVHPACSSIFPSNAMLLSKVEQKKWTNVPLNLLLVVRLVFCPHLMTSYDASLQYLMDRKDHPRL
mmetsp:Transcript_2420/g.7095  ORF Transcript_2420/g.7095 Transcript_2420/m.7095 type:complete len:80 (-) Transcript_2420:44-283(-)